MQTSADRAQDISKELEYQATHLDAVEPVCRTRDATIRRYAETRRWRLFPKEFVFRCIHRFAPKRICDFGCGAGETSTELARLGYEVVGFDISPELIEMSRQRARLDEVEGKARFLLANAAEVQLQDGQFDLVLMQAVLHHIDLKEGLASGKKLLKPGGIVVIREPIVLVPFLQRLRDWIPVAKDISPNERQLTASDLRLIAGEFEILETRYFRLLGRLNRILPARLHRIPLWLDWVLLSCLPFLRTWTGNVVIAGRKRPDQ